MTIKLFNKEPMLKLVDQLYRNLKEIDGKSITQKMSFKHPDDNWLIYEVSITVKESNDEDE